jgi:hypothetical protein
LDRGAQGLALGVLETIVGLPRQYDAKHAAQNGRCDDHHRERSDELCDGRFAMTPMRRPPEGGQRSDS